MFSDACLGLSVFPARGALQYESGPVCLPLGSCPSARSGVRDGHQEHAALVPPCCPRPGTAVACGACQVRPACLLQVRVCKYGGTEDVSCPRVLLAEQELPCSVCCPAGRRG